MFLLQRDESRRVGGANSRTSVLDRLVGDREFTKVMSNHFGLQMAKCKQTGWKKHKQDI